MGENGIPRMIVFGVAFLLLASVANATTILDCKNQALTNCVVTESSSVASSDSPFYLENVTIDSGVTVTVTADNGCGYPGGGASPGGGCFTIYGRNITISGNVSTDAGVYSGGGASGGTIRIFGKSISGQGSLSSRGSDGGYCCGGGAAGSVQIYAEDMTFSGTIFTTGGANWGYTSVVGGGAGGAGGQGGGCGAGNGAGGAGGPGVGNTGGPANASRGIYISAILSNNINIISRTGAGVKDGNMHMIGAFPKNLSNYASSTAYWGPSILTIGENFGPSSSPTINMYSEDDLLIPIWTRNANPDGFTGNSILRQNESKDYRVQLTNAEVNSFVTYAGYGNDNDSATHITLTTQSSSPSIKLRRVYLTVYDASHNPAANEDVIVRNTEGGIVARGNTNASGTLFFWLPYHDLDTAETRMKYTVEVDSSAYPGTIIFNNVTSPQHIRLGGASADETAKRDAPHEMKVNKVYEGALTFTPDTAMSNLRFVQDLPAGFSLEGNAVLKHGNSSGIYSCTVNGMSGTTISINSSNCALLTETTIFGAGTWFHLSYQYRTPLSSQISGDSQSYNLSTGGVYADLI